MTDAAPATLKALKDAPLPAPSDWTPQTMACLVAFAVIGLAVVALIAFAVRQHRAQRYRRAALSELAEIEGHLADTHTRPAAALALATLLKRCALAVRPRAEVASLSGSSWRTWLAASGRSGNFDSDLEKLVYGPPDKRADRTEHALSDLKRKTRRWIMRHSRNPKSREKQ